MSHSTNPSTAGGFVPPTVEALDEKLPAYEVLGVLGSGGMGAVYKARQISLDRLVAIKILPNIDDDGDLRFAERFQREARAMAKLSHPNILSVFDFGSTDDGQLFFVMEFVDGTDLHQVITSGGMTMDHVYGWLPQICDALQYAHSNGIVHRDIKPANIMITKEGAVKIADFGLAKHTTTTEAHTQLTLANVAMGTPDYIAPEALEEGIEVDHRADLYSLGVMIYQMLTGKIPRGVFSLPSEVNPEIDPRIDALVSRTMESDRDSRTQQASEISSTLYEIQSTPAKADEAPLTASGKKLITGVPADTSPLAAKPAPTQAPPVKKSPTPILLSLAAVAAIGAILFFVFNKGEKDKPLADAPPPETPTSDPLEPKPEPETLTPDPKPNAEVLPEIAALSPPPPAPEPVAPEAAAPPDLPPSSTPPVPDPAAANSPTATADSPPALVMPERADPPPAPKPEPSEAEVRIGEIDERLMSRFDEVAGNAFAASVAKLNQGYLTVLETTRKTISATGDLDAVVAVENEKKAVEALGNEPLADPIPASAPVALKQSRKKYDDALAAYIETRDAEIPQLLSGYDQLLGQLQAELTKAEKTDQALIVRRTRKAVDTAGHPLLPKTYLVKTDLTRVAPANPGTPAINPDSAKLLAPQRGRQYGFGEFEADRPLAPITDSRGKMEPEVRNLVSLVTAHGHFGHRDNEGRVTVGSAPLDPKLEFEKAVVSYRCGIIGVLKGGKLFFENPDPFPPEIDPGTIDDAVDVATSLWNQAVLRKDGSVVAWKYAEPGKLAALPGGNEFGAVFGGNESILFGRKLDGSFASLHPGHEPTETLVAKLNGFVSPVVKISGGHPFLILKEDGKVFQFEEIDIANMAEVPGDLPPAIDIRAGFKVSAARLPDGTWRAWGNNDKGIVDKINSFGGDVFDLSATDQYVLWLR